jgi:FAD/FMN-containing dehydrogenase
MYAGPATEGERLLRRLRELERPVLLDMSGVMPYNAVQSLLDDAFPGGSQRYYWKSLFLNGLDAEVLRTIGAWLNRRPSKRTLLSIRTLGGEIARVPYDATAFGERDAPFLLSIDSTWLDPIDDEENIMWTRAFWAAMRCFSSGKTYFNFAGLLEDADAVPASYGANHERLMILKTKYDPDNLFRVNQNITPL